MIYIHQNVIAIFNSDQMYLIQHWTIIFNWTLNNLIWLPFWTILNDKHMYYIEIRYPQHSVSSLTGSGIKSIEVIYNIYVTRRVISCKEVDVVWVYESWGGCVFRITFLVPKEIFSPTPYLISIGTWDHHL
jgi:hypothetical protein